MEAPLLTLDMMPILEPKGVGIRDVRWERASDDRSRIINRIDGDTRKPVEHVFGYRRPQLPESFDGVRKADIIRVKNRRERPPGQLNRLIYCRRLAPILLLGINDVESA